MNHLSRTKGDRLFDCINVALLSVVLFLVLYPLYVIVISSFSDPDLVNAGEIWLIPHDITFEGYQRILSDDSIWTGYRNSIMYTVIGTSINVLLTITSGYALSRKDLVGRQFFILIIVFTMFFSGGIIPSYLLVKEFGMVNTMWALIIPSAVTAFNVIITRTFFQTTIPDELLEASQMDGCRNIVFFIRIVLPLSVPIIAVMVLFSAVSHWNSYFNALIYLQDESLYPLQLILRKILVANEAQAAMVDNLNEIMEQQRIADLMKYGVIIVSSLPVLVLYPFLQKYFVKGLMIGSVKG